MSNKILLCNENCPTFLGLFEFLLKSYIVLFAKQYFSSLTKLCNFHRSVYPDCPISIFNFIPDVYTKDDDVTVSFDPPETQDSIPNKVKKMFCFVAKLKLFINLKTGQLFHLHFVVGRLDWRQFSG
jgi:hypothetical protein